MLLLAYFYLGCAYVFLKHNFNKLASVLFTSVITISMIFWAVFKFN